MKLTIVYIFTFYVFKSATGFQRSKIIGTVNDLLDELALEKWHQQEVTCIQATQDILNGVKNSTLWATWVWDSMQLPVGALYGTLYHLGNFDQCLKTPWPPHQGVQTQYCLVDVKLAAVEQYDELVNPYDSVEKYIGAEYRRRNRSNTLFLGVCLPASCRSESIAKISRHIFSLSHLPFEDVIVDPRDCQVTDAKVEKSIGYCIFWLIILAMVAACILVYCFGNTQNKSDSIVFKIRFCFCLTRNFDALTEVYKDEINMIRGMRALTCGTLIVAHFILRSQSTFINQMDVEQELLNNSFSSLSLHTDLCVDTFFVMSGLLYFRALLSSRSYQPFKTLFKRYLRLFLPLHALSISFMTYVLPHFGSGPLWLRMARKHFEPCTRSWWGNLLMITNKVDDVAFCSETSWYIHCDFQLTILATVIFMVYKRNNRIGIIFCSLAYVLSVTVLAIWNFWEELPGLLCYDFGESVDIEANKVYKSVYKPFYTRASSYLIGLAMGYIMVVYKPQNNRKTISKTISILGFIIGMSLMVFSLHMGARMFRKDLSILGIAIIAALDKTMWSIGICCIITACEYGTLPIVNDFLSSNVFMPLSKLSYSAYLFHIIFIYTDIFSIRSPGKFNMLSMIIHGLGYVVITFSVCYLLWLFMEAPVTNLMNVVFDFNNRGPKIQNVDIKRGTHSNGVTKTEKVL